MELITTSSKCVEAGELWPKFSEESLRVVLKSSNEKLSLFCQKFTFRIRSFHFCWALQYKVKDNFKCSERMDGLLKWTTTRPTHIFCY